MEFGTTGDWILFVTQVPYLALDERVFQFPSDSGGVDIELTLRRDRQHEPQGGLFDMLGGTQGEFGEAFQALLATVGFRYVSLATWTVTGFAGPPSADRISEVFWHDCVSVLDEVSFAYRVVTGEGLAEVSPELLRHPIVYLLLSGHEVTRAGSLVRPQPGFEDDGAPDEVLEAMQATIVARYMGEPFIEWRRWLERARDDRKHGAFAACVISLQTGMESFFSELRSLLILDYRTRGEPGPQETEELSFKWVVQSVGRWIGHGQWALSAATPLGRYWSDLYLLRNRVIHDSYRPTESEVVAAMTAHDDVRQWIAELLLEHPKQFPRTLIGFPGAGWLLSSGRATRYLRDQIARYSEEGCAYWTDEPL